MRIVSQWYSRLNIYKWLVIERLEIKWISVYKKNNNDWIEVTVINMKIIKGRDHYLLFLFIPYDKNICTYQHFFFFRFFFLYVFYRLVCVLLLFCWCDDCFPPSHSLVVFCLVTTDTYTSIIWFYSSFFFLLFLFLFHMIFYLHTISNLLMSACVFLWRVIIMMIALYIFFF